MTGLLNSGALRWSVLALALLLFAVTNLPWHLDDYDQAKQAFTSFEMVEQGHWFYQHTPNWWVATKPPLVGWISAGFFAVTRSWDIAWRLPSFLATLALLALLMRSAAVYGGIPALVAACAFSFNLFVPRLASLVRTDMPLALVVFAIGWLIWEKLRTRAAWTARDRLLLFLLLSAGMLIKGPIVYAFLLPGIAAFEWWRRKTGGPAAVSSGWLPWLVSFLVFILWAAGGILFVPEFTEHVVAREFLGRFSDGYASGATVLLLRAAFAASFRAVELAADFVAADRVEKNRDSRLPPRDVAGNILARRLEPRGIAGDVFRSLQTDRSHLSDCAAALSASGGGGW